MTPQVGSSSPSHQTTPLPELNSPIDVGLRPNSPPPFADPVATKTTKRPNNQDPQMPLLNDTPPPQCPTSMKIQRSYDPVA